MEVVYYNQTILEAQHDETIDYLCSFVEEFLKRLRTETFKEHWG
jgi:hypothetical protein